LEPAGYASLAADTCRSFAGAFESLNHETLEYARSLFGIFTKPFDSYAPRAIVKEQIVRSAAAVSATISSLEATNGHAAEFAREIAEIVTTAHETYVDALRGLADTSVSNVTFVKNAPTRNARLTLPLPSVN
jgi:hypothetical protein